MYILHVQVIMYTVQIVWLEIVVIGTYISYPTRANLMHSSKMSFKS